MPPHERDGRGCLTVQAGLGADCTSMHLKRRRARRRWELGRGVQNWPLPSGGHGCALTPLTEPVKGVTQPAFLKRSPALSP
eukprot:3013473-Pleurochrysis_carterae.AAC.1